MPNRNPPDLFKFLEEVFSCRPNKREKTIREGTQPEQVEEILARSKLVKQNHKKGDPLGTYTNSRELKALLGNKKNPDSTSNLTPKYKEIPSSSLQLTGSIESFLNSIFCCPQGRK